MQLAETPGSEGASGAAAAEQRTIRLAALTTGAGVPSARFRVRQMVPHMVADGVEVTELAPKIGIYQPSPSRTGRSRPLRAAGEVAWTLQKAWARSGDLRAAKRFDGAWVCRELLPNVPGLDGLLSVPFVLDLDDAVWARNAFSEHAFRRTASRARLVLAGNEYLAEFAARYADVVLVPTAVDTDRLRPGRRRSDGEGFVVGWIGTSSNFKYLQAIEHQLAHFLSRHPNARLRVVANRAPALPGIDPEAWEFVPWAEDKELEVIRGFDVGIMPLADDRWSRGKCGYKLLSYLACAVPGIASDVGPNRQILAGGAAGWVVERQDDWFDALEEAYSDAAERADRGRFGRQHTELNYSCKVVAPVISSALHRVF